MTNRVIKKLDSDLSCRFLYPHGTFVWLIGGFTTDPVLEGMLRYRIVRDIETLNRLVKPHEQPVAILSDTMAAPLAAKLLTKIPRWSTVRFGRGELEVENPDLICARSADLVIVYGEPTDRLYEVLADRDEEKHGPEPEVIIRDVTIPVKVKQSLHSEEDPYARYWADIYRLRKWRLIPKKGLQIRDTIDMRPKYKV